MLDVVRTELCCSVLNRRSHGLSCGVRLDHNGGPYIVGDGPSNLSRARGGIEVQNGTFLRGEVCVLWRQVLPALRRVS